METQGGLGSTAAAEISQAKFRLIAGPMFVVGMLAVLLVRHADALPLSSIATLVSIYLVCGAGLLMWAIRRPGVSVVRRALSLALDYTAVGGVMIVGGVEFLPAYAPILWVTVGYGLRLGSHYLIAATGLALLTILLAWIFNPFWAEYPQVPITLAVTTLVVPFYAYKLIERVAAAQRAAEDANRAKSSFLAQASHDLRQPIHAMSLFIACLRDAGLGKEERSMVENIDRSLHSVSRLFRSLLDISTLESGKVQPKARAVAVGELIADIARQNAQAADWAGATLRVVESRCHVHADEVLLTTMVQNIVTNALKYAPGRPVLIGCRRRGKKLAIAVYDRGEGIAAEHLEGVFNEFYQVRERGDRDIEGVGLGLPIVRRLGQLMGLTVTMRSTVGRGTAVVIDGLAIVPAPEARPKQAIGTLTNGLRVLLVEDDRDVLQATATLLEKWGCIVRSETAPPSTVGACDVLITDFDLGDKRTGADCIELVRGQAGHEVPAIVMTGHDETRVRAELDDPSIPILAKPVRPAEMRSVLTSLFARTTSDSATVDQASP